MSTTVNLEEARQNIEAAWEKVADASISAPPAILAKIEEILGGDVTYKYILVTGLLGKLTNQRVHARALQVGSSLPEAYDARSLCHRVVVPFEKTKGNLFGLSDEPFLNKPARHPEHDKNNKQLRNKRLAALTHDVLEAAQTASPVEVEAMLVSALRLGKEIAAAQVSATVEVDSTLQHVLRFVQEFLRETDGGAHLVAITGAFVTLLSEGFTVKVYPPTYADKFAKTSGDIEVFAEENLLSAYECKHRPLTLADVRHGIKKARENGIPEYVFVYAAGLAAGEEEAIKQEVDAAQEERDVALVNITTAARLWAVILNSHRRATFGETVATILREAMNRAEIANNAASLWNRLE
jgi:hypothetical protein